MVEMETGRKSDGIRMWTLFFCAMLIWKSAVAGVINMVQYRFESGVPEDLTSAMFRCAFQHNSLDSSGVKLRRDGRDDCNAITPTDSLGDSSYLNLTKHEQITQPVPPTIIENGARLDLNIPGIFDEKCSIRVRVQCDNYTKQQFSLSLRGETDTDVVVAIFVREAETGFEYKMVGNSGHTYTSLPVFPFTENGRAYEVKFHVSNGNIEVDIDGQAVYTRPNAWALEPTVTRKLRLDVAPGEQALTFRKFYFSN